MYCKRSARACRWSIGAVSVVGVPWASMRAGWRSKPGAVCFAGGAAPGVRGRPREEDRKQLAAHVVAGAVGLDPQHVDLVAEGGHLLDQMEAERPAAGDLDRRGVRGERAQHRRARRLRLRRRPGRVAAERRAHVQVQPLDVFELELLDAADVRSFLVRDRAVPGGARA